MSSSNLSNNQFRLYHGTNRKIKGDYIHPTKQRGEVWEGAGPEAAFASDRIDIASEYGQHVYEVHPTGSEEEYADNVYGSSEGFKIKRKLHPDVVERYNKVMGPIHEANFRREHYANVVHHEYGPDGRFEVHHDADGNVSKRIKLS